MDYDLYTERLKKLRKKVELGGRTKMVICSSCRDEYPELIGRRLTGYKCPECYKEIRFGVISRKPVNFGFFRDAGVREETSSFWDNSVRCLEESL